MQVTDTADSSQTSRTETRPLSVRDYGWREWLTIAPEWAQLAEVSGASFFLHPEWVQTWIEAFGADLKPRILMFGENGATVGACLLVRRLAWLKFVPLRRVYLNCAGEPEADGTCVEYNRLLCAPGHESSVSAHLRQYLAAGVQEEVALHGMEAQDGTECLLSAALGVQSYEKPAWYVDLSALRRDNTQYEAELSSSTRAQIRRSLKLFEETAGPMRLQAAVSVQDGLEFLNQLSRLHQSAWSSRGKPGVFASSRFVEFHRQLIRRGWEHDHVHLLRVTAGDRIVGLLYNFFYRGRVYFYQSGFAYEQDNRLKPGLVTHFMAVKHYLAKPDALEYDLLAGDSQYKRSLAKNQRTLKWITVQQPTLRSKIVAALRNLRATSAKPAN